MIEAVLGRHTSRREPPAVRPEPHEHHDTDVGGGTVPLRQLLAVAQLTSVQAALLVTDVIDQVDSARGLGRQPSSLRGAAVTVSEAGRLTIERMTRSAASAPDVTSAVAGLVRTIAANSDKTEFNDRVRESTSTPSDLDDLIRHVRPAVAVDLDPDAEARRRRQIGDLVTVAGGRPLPDGRVVAATPAAGDLHFTGAGSLAPNTWFPPVRTVWHRRRRRPSRRLVLFSLIALLVLGTAVVAVPRVWGELGRGWNAVLSPDTPTAGNEIEPVSPPPEPPPELRGVPPAPVPSDAPASADPITAVTATFADGRCSAGRPCVVRVDAHFDPDAAVPAVTWKLVVHDRCSGEVRTGGDVTVPAEPGREQVYGLDKVDLPPGRALAVVAETSAPTVAASSPLLVPAENAAC